MSKRMGQNSKYLPKFKKLKKTKSNKDELLPSSWKLVKQTYEILVGNWRTLGTITLAYLVLFILFIRVAPQISLQDYESLLDEFAGEGTSGASKNFTLAGVALQSGTSAGLGLSGIFILIIMSLVYIWSLRHIAAGKKFKIRDALYQSQTSLISFTLVAALLVVQLTPFGIGGTVYSIVQAQNIAITPLESSIFLGLWVLLAILSGFWVTKTLMALYAVTLPGMYPVAALRAAKRLVAGRRWHLFRKIVFLPLLAGALFFISFLFVVAVVPSVAYWLIDLASVLVVPIAHTYYYSLYRSLV